MPKHRRHDKFFRKAESVADVLETRSIERGIRLGITGFLKTEEPEVFFTLLLSTLCDCDDDNENSTMVKDG